MKHRKESNDIKTGAFILFRDEHGRCPTYCPCGVRCIGGVTLIPGFRAELENLAGDIKGKSVTTQVVWLAHARRRDLAKSDGSRDRASMMFQPCFLAVETKERISAKSIAPCNDRKPPEIF